MTDIQAARCVRLAEYLEAVPSENFDMLSWRRTAWCGTVCCAAGHAAYVHEFWEEGYTLNASPSFGGEVGDDALALFFGDFRPFHSKFYWSVPVKKVAVIERLREVAKTAQVVS